MVIGIRNSTIFALMLIIPKTESNKAKVCPMVKTETKQQNTFPVLKSNTGSLKRLKTEHDRRRGYLKHV